MAGPLNTQAITFRTVPGVFRVPARPRLTINNPNAGRSPASLSVSLTSAPANAPVQFLVDGVIATSGQTRVDGTCGPITVPASGPAGAHTLTAHFPGNPPVADASATFTLQAPVSVPLPVGADTTPNMPPQTTKWVFQDPTGVLPTWTMDFNPRKMMPIPWQRVLQMAHSKFGGRGFAETGAGQFHISEPLLDPQDWSFSGFCPNKAFYDKLAAWATLNTRWYLRDHRGRVWLVVSMGFEMVPRKRGESPTGFEDWRGDYTFHVALMQQTPVQTVQTTFGFGHGPFGHTMFGH